MKKLILLSLCAISAALAGCGTVGGVLQKTPVSVTPATTNFTAVISPQVTNAAGIVTPSSTNYTAVVMPPVTNFEFSIAAAPQKFLSTAQALTPLAPQPYGAAAAGILALISGALGLLVKAKNKQLNAAQAVADIVQPLVAGVEAAGTPAVKQAIKSHAIAAGVQNVLDPIVQSVSGQMAPGNVPITVAAK